MKKIKVNQEFWDVFPEGQLEVMIIKGIDNSKEDMQFQEKLKASSITAQKYISNDVFTDNEVIKDWRKAFSSIKTKKGARCSIEALLKRISKDQEITSINPLVDLYNCISLEYGVPCGGEDILKISGELVLGEAKGGEEFIPLGSEEDSPALEKEMIYYDEAGAVCRSLNWREAKRTMLTADTTDAVFILESVYSHQVDNLVNASIALKKSLEEYFGVKVEQYSINNNNKVVEL